MVRCGECLKKHKERWLTRFVNMVETAFRDCEAVRSDGEETG